jgi:transcriptional regulator
MEYVNFIHGTKFYKILVKIFNEVNESDVKVSNSEINEVKSEKVSDIVENKESYDFPSSYQQIESEKIGNVKSN